MFFSQRHGLKTIPEMQIEDMNDDLRIGLWNAFYNYFMSSFASSAEQNGTVGMQTDLLYKIWLYALKRPGDEFAREPKRLIMIYKRYFTTAKWHEVFDIVEYAAGKYQRDDVCREFMLECNFVLEKEVSAYRFVDGTIVPVYELRPAAPVLVPEGANTPLEVDQIRLQKALSLYTTQTTQKKAMTIAAKRTKAAEGGTAL
jgi:hypothetical protein